MDSYLLVSETALKRCLENAPDNWYDSFQCPLDEHNWGVWTAQHDGNQFLVTANESNVAPRALIRIQGRQSLSSAPSEARKSAFQRIHRVLVMNLSPPVRLPPAWSEFHLDNLIAFFACGREKLAWRWVAERNVLESNDVAYWELTSERGLTLESFKGSQEHSRYLDAYRVITEQWSEAVREGTEKLSSISREELVPRVQGNIDLEEATFGAVTQWKNYEGWLEELTVSQKQFLDCATDRSVKLRGPAGSGKTLSLALKILREVYATREQNESRRFLFATHSWTVAQQVDDMISQLNNGNVPAEIEIYPLLEIARDRMPVDRASIGLPVLGDDSMSGRLLQIEKISTILETLRRSDWLAYQTGCSPEFNARVESVHDSVEHMALVWDLMMEFSSVLGARGIMPGVNAERHYLGMERQAWMMPLANDFDKRFVLRVYTDYIKDLQQERILTSDQLIRDFLNYLETFTWNTRRTEYGYDMIFVDELHLFTEQERMVLHYLTRSGAEHPKLFMALDPRQAPFEVYAEFAGIEVGSRESGAFERELGPSGQQIVDLSMVHRFSPEILALVQHIHLYYPALDLGPDWAFNADALESSRNRGSKPVLIVHVDCGTEICAVLESARSQAATSNADKRVAVVVLDPLRLEGFAEEALRGKGKWSVIRSRDDVDELRYSHRNVVISAAEYVAGLQFSDVIVAGFPRTNLVGKGTSHQLRRFLSQLYLAVSRAANTVAIHTNEQFSGLPQILQQAVASDIVDRQEG